MKLLIFASLVSLSFGLLKDEWNTVDQFTFNLMEARNLEAHNARLFRHQPGLHVRHNLEFHLALKHHKTCGKPFQFSLTENEKIVFTWIQAPSVVQNDELVFNLYVNRSIPVGQYALNAHDPCFETKSPIVSKSTYLGDVRVMFNPWFEPTEENSGRTRRQTFTNSFTNEYMHNSYDFIWLWGQGICWDYALDSQVVILSRDILMQLMSPSERSDKVLYSRALSNLINDYVLLGRWDGEYSDGIAPWEWVGSQGILARWLWTGQRVRYGQCWVFAALLTTLLRVSGIPARTVTNYDSHHDRGILRDGIRQYDNIKQEDESIWNFHVWSEAWFERPDLGQPADWNAVDATPQEPSPLALGEPYRTGPAYVPFIRANMRTANYDTYFVLAEVNAIEVCPVTGRSLGPVAGYAVVTKKPGMQRDVYSYSNPEFITNSYKIQSGTSKRASEDTNPSLPPPDVGCKRDGGMRLNSTSVNPRVGETFVITVTEISVPIESVVVRMELRNYMGESLGFLETFTGLSEISVTESDYLPYLRNSSIFRFTVGIYNESETAEDVFIFHDALRIVLMYEELEVETENDPNSDTITLTVSYTNPLSVPLTGVMVSVSGPNNTYMRIEQPDIPARSRFMTTVEVYCGNDDDADVMIPISLDSDVTRSVYGAGWASCNDTDGPTNGDSAMIPGTISVFLASFLGFLVLLL